MIGQSSIYRCSVCKDRVTGVAHRIDGRNVCLRCYAPATGKYVQVQPGVYVRAQVS